MKKIVLEHGVKKDIMRIFNTSYTAIGRALRYETNTPLARKIRKAAINRGGILFESSSK